jgi:sugar lactone lactonase YvrE
MSEHFKVISEGPYLCGETPIWDPIHQQLYWSDMLAGTLHRYDRNSKKVQEIAKGKNVSGFTQNRDGGLVCATHQGVYVWHENKGFQLIADQVDGHPLHCNDATADARGRFLFGTTFYGPNMKRGEYSLGKLFSLEGKGTFKVLDEGIYLTNGLAFSLDQRTLYYTDTVERVIYAYEYNLDRGTVSNKRIFVKVPNHEGIPDGLTVDSEGYLWSAQWYGSCVVRYTPEGQVDRYIETPMRQTSSVMFGGPDLSSLFITTASLSVTLDVAPKGYDYKATNVGGPVFEFDAGVQGVVEHVADVLI